MLRPLSDMIIIEQYKEISGITLPEGREFEKGEFFVVKAVGPGFTNDEGVLIEPEVKVGDVVALVGKILKIPFKGVEYLIARAGDAIAVVEEMDEEETKSEREASAGGEQPPLGQGDRKAESLQEA